MTYSQTAQPHRGASTVSKDDKINFHNQEFERRINDIRSKFENNVQEIKSQCETQINEQEKEFNKDKNDYHTLILQEIEQKARQSKQVLNQYLQGKKLEMMAVLNEEQEKVLSLEEKGTLRNRHINRLETEMSQLLLKIKALEQKNHQL